MLSVPTWAKLLTISVKFVYVCVCVCFKGAIIVLMHPTRSSVQSANTLGLAELGGWGEDTNREIVSFRSFVRASARSGCKVGMQFKRDPHISPFPFCLNRCSLFHFWLKSFSLSPLPPKLLSIFSWPNRVYIYCVSPSVTKTPFHNSSDPLMIGDPDGPRAPLGHGWTSSLLSQRS